jgi:hypothetical protein
MANANKSTNRYSAILELIFQKNYLNGVKEFAFERLEIEKAAKELLIELPKNIGDLIYSFRYRTDLPASICNTAEVGNEWIIEAAGKSKYLFKQVQINRIFPRKELVTTKIPDATPEIVLNYAQGDEQSLLAKVRYNRLIDIFLGLTTYSLQNHLRTTVRGKGQIEIDELYIGLDRNGCHYVIPVQAKAGKDQLSAVQASQDLAFCKQKFPALVCRAISAQFMDDQRIAMFELTIQGDQIKVMKNTTSWFRQAIFLSKTLPDTEPANNS